MLPTVANLVPRVPKLLDQWVVARKDPGFKNPEDSEYEIGRLPKISRFQMAASVPDLALV